MFSSIESRVFASGRLSAVRAELDREVAREVSMTWERAKIGPVSAWGCPKGERVMIAEDQFELGAVLWENRGSEARLAVDRRTGRRVSLLWPRRRSDLTRLREYVQATPTSEGVLRYSEALRDREGNDVIVAEALEPDVKVLSDLVRARRLRPEEARWIAREALLILARCHAEGRTLGPLRPRSLLLSWGPSWRLRVLPAAPPPDQGGPVSDDDRFGVTYMPPELLADWHESPACDVYSLMAVVHHAVVGRPPFRQGPLPQLFRRIHAGYRSAKDAPPEWREALRWGLQSDPTQRPAALDLLRSLSRGGLTRERK